MTTAAQPRLLNPRWDQLRHHAKQRAYFDCQALVTVVPAGRRSGKSEIAKRRVSKRSLRGTKHDNPRFFAAAPTRDQAKRIFWKDLKRMIPKDAMRGRPSETELVIPLWHGGELCVIGMDKPERMEGSPWDGGILDEYGNMKPEAWGENVQPALADRNGWCDMIGVPEGRNHYYDVAEQAKALMLSNPAEWAHFHWVSADILPPEKIAQAKRDLDLLTFQQEYEASFVNFSGRAYYCFGDRNKGALRKLYNPRATLIICLDFNVEPGVAAVCQELMLPVGGIGTAAIGEVWIDNNSNTPAVCRRLLLDWGAHEGRVEVYGDSTGGARGTAKVQGSDWDIAKDLLKNGAGEFQGFGQRVSFHVKSANPAERARVNAVNSRTLSGDGTIRLMVDAQFAPHLAKDLDGVALLKGGSGEIDKKKDPKLTHISDAIGYYIDYRFPVVQQGQYGSSQFRV
ncbi:MAG TPA: hypothetical protein VK681_39230 [Reyranella sp.]|nr:hypothetical protein [Reyranella sp.]